MPRAFKVGDRVKILSGACWPHKRGNVGTVVKDDGQAICPFHVSVDGSEGVYDADELEKVSDPGTGSAAPFKPGDRVRYTGKHPHINNPDEVGKTGVVEEVHGGTAYVKWDHSALRIGRFFENIELCPESPFAPGDRVEYIAGPGQHSPWMVGSRGAVVGPHGSRPNMVRVQFSAGHTRSCLKANLRRITTTDTTDTASATESATDTVTAGSVMSADNLKTRARKLEDEARALEAEASAKSSEAHEKRQQAQTLRKAAAIVEAA